MKLITRIFDWLESRGDGYDDQGFWTRGGSGSGGVAPSEIGDTPIDFWGTFVAEVEGSWHRYTRKLQELVRRG